MALEVIAMQLTDEQLGMLDVLMYEDGDGSGIFRGNEGKTLGEILDELDRSGYDFAASDELIDAIRNDPRLSDLVLADVDSYDERGAHAAAFVENTAGGGRNTYVAFQGTGTGETIDGQATNSEWYTDALGLEQSDTQPQREAREYVKYVAEHYGSPVTVTGHSNGANKAMYVAATSDVVDRCVAFDGQGFSPAFFDKYADLIDKNSDKVTFYGLEDDYVGPLLRPLPIDKEYIAYGDSYDGDNPGETFMLNHGMESFFTSYIDENGKRRYGFKKGQQSPFSQQIESFIIHIYDKLSTQQLAILAPVIGQILDSLLGTKGRSIQEVLSDDANRAGVVLLIAVACSYDGWTAFIDATLDAFGDAMSDEMREEFERLRSIPGNLWAVLKAFGITQLFDMIVSLNGVLISAGSLAVINITQDALGFDAMASNLVREFTEAKKQELLSIVREVEQEEWWDPTRWDVWYRGERFFGRLTIDNYQNDMRTYYRKVADIEGATTQTIEDNFSRVAQQSMYYQGDVAAKLIENVRSIDAAIEVG